jgi:hypothetical protein
VRISLNPKAVQELRPGELASRFVLGGAITAAAGLIAGLYGPTIGGLFLAFPSILPASLTLVAKHQEQRKAERGLRGIARGRQAASLDALGALIGTAGLVGFAVSTQIAATRINPALTLIVATTVWLGIATGLWRLRRVS